MKAFSALLRLDEIEKAIVVEALKGPVRPSELPKRIKIAKSTAYRKVKELERMRVLVKRDGATVEEYFLSEDLRKAIRI
ncbi:MAG: hypothetical protein N3F67_06105 [Acidilobaceae archaeon]|nr:hypothetical protein [Acidilobaceae archaeon]